MITKFATNLRTAKQSIESAMDTVTECERAHLRELTWMETDTLDEIIGSLRDSRNGIEKVLQHCLQRGMLLIDEP